MGINTPRFKTRYAVHTQRARTMYNLAIKRGMLEHDDAVLDYVDPGECIIEEFNGDLMNAGNSARRLVAGDFFGAPRIYKQVWDDDRETWRDICYWEVSSGVQDVEEDAPTHTYEEEDY